MVFNLPNAAISSTVPHIVVTLNSKINPLILHNYNIATIMGHNVNILHAGYVICVTTYRLRTSGLKHNCLEEEMDRDRDRQIDRQRKTGDYNCVLRNGTQIKICSVGW